MGKGIIFEKNKKLASVAIPKDVKLAIDDAASKAKRQALKEKLLKSERIVLTKEGSVTDEKGEKASIAIPKDVKLAVQWYERDPLLLEMEKAAMERSFPNFTLEKLEDGSLYWVGYLNVGISETKTGIPSKYYVMAIYQNNHPYQQMGSSVRIYPICPDVDDLINKLGFQPSHLIRDSSYNLYLCTNRAEDQKVGDRMSTAASVLAFACRWFIAYELVLTGDLSKEEFCKHGAI